VRVRVAAPARADLASLLLTSEERWGAEARRRYASLVEAAIRTIAEAPDSSLTHDRAELAAGLRSMHLRHARTTGEGAGVRDPVHVIYYRLPSKDVLEIVRVLHERMEPTLQLAPVKRPARAGRRAPRRSR